MMADARNRYQQPQPTPQSTQPQSAQPQQQHYYQDQSAYRPQKKKKTAATLAFLIGAFGAHKFYTGATGAAVIMLLISVIGSIFTFGLSFCVMSIIASIEFCSYVCTNDDEWQRIYIDGKKSWF